MVANSRYDLESIHGGTEAEFVDRIIIPGIPNYIGVDCPCHKCMEELRENHYMIRVSKGTPMRTLKISYKIANLCQEMV